jgi:hypothetical protein
VYKRQAYSYSKTKYTIDGINGGKAYPPRHDRTHTINILANIDLNNFANELSGRNFESTDKNWALGFNFTFFSGQPITLPASIYLANQMPDWDINQTSVALYPSEINKYRLPYYSRLDLSLNYEIQYDGWSLSPYLQIFNVLNRKNVWFIRYKNEIKNGALYQKISTVNMFPILPSIGISVKF